MNPFDLTGPEFLKFYVVLGVAVVAIVWFWGSLAAAGKTKDPNLSDPYLIACLRGGPDEALRVATCALLERGLLLEDNKTLAAARPDAPYLVQAPIEKALMKEFSKQRPASDMFRSGLSMEAARELEDSLVDRGLVRARSRRFVSSVGTVFLAGVAATKIAIALQRGRTNVAFLILLAVGFAVLLALIGGLRQTFQGLRTLGDLRNLFRGRQMKAYTVGKDSGDLALLAGVFGLAAVWNHSRGDEFRRLFPKSANEKGAVTTHGATCGSVSSCGSSGSSCGSSCGGGGGGGGCGGCGS
jgi:uncharacterized protein (TIGR04222 family)